MYKSLCEEYNSYFNVGAALCSFFLMNENDINSYIENINSYLLQIKNNNKKIKGAPNIEKLRNDTIEVLNYAKHHFNVIVPENDAKMQYLYLPNGEIDFTWPDKYVEFAKMNNQKLRWHTLVWHNQVPEWIFHNDNNTYCSKIELEKRLRNYISTLGARYKNDIYSIDVVNECISDNFFCVRNGAEKSKWFDIIGKDYIQKAFFWTKEAFPNSNLVINDYSLESNINKRNGMYRLLKELLVAKTPIDTIGLQMHVSINNPLISEIEETIKMFGDLGLKIIISELDVSIYEDNHEEKIFEPEKVITSELLTKQAARYYELFECFKKYAKEGILTDVIFWGITDRFSWRNNFPIKNRKDAPLLFDRKGNPKPAFFKLIKE